MGNYNPRQITQMRWRDAKNLEKFIKGQIALYDIEVSNGNTYNFDAVPEAKELAEKIRYCFDNQIPMTIYEYSNDIVYYTESFSDNSRLNLIRVSNDIKKLGYIQTYDDRIEINITDEETLTKDNVKTLFGDKSIVGTGNIDLYRHSIHYYQDNVTIDFEIISSNNLKVDSLTDLKTLCKNNAVVIASGQYILNDVKHIITAVKVTADAVFGFYDGTTANRIPLTTNQFTDTITTI